MKINITGKNLQISEALKERIEKKLGKMDKFFHTDAVANVVMHVTKNNHIMEVSIHFNNLVIRSEVASDDMYNALDRNVDNLERQIRKNKTRLAKRLRENAFKPDNWETGSIENTPEQIFDEEEHDFQIIKTKKFAAKPMTVEESILQMNLLGHDFFIFTNGTSNKINVVYKRNDGNYGVIEPEN